MIENTNAKNAKPNVQLDMFTGQTFNGTLKPYCEGYQMPNLIEEPAQTVEWETPADVFNPINARFKFELDVCATPQNTKCTRFYTKEDDALIQDWEGVCWMNPPYGPGIEDWMRRAYNTARKNRGIVVALIPVRTDTQWWKWAMKADELYFITGRLNFVGGNSAAKFPNAVAVYDIGSGYAHTVQCWDYKIEPFPCPQAGYRAA